MTRSRGLLSVASLAFALLLLSGCKSGPKIRVDKDPSVDMTAYKTFGFFDHLATDEAQYTTIVTSRLKQATRDQLERRGYTYSESNPDLRANFYLNITDKTEIRSSPSMSAGYYGYRGGAYGGWAGYPYDVDTVNYQQGTLTIDLVDAKKSALVWQGLAEGRVRDEARKEPGPAIDAVVSEIFANFPNGPQ